MEAGVPLLPLIAEGDGDAAVVGTASDRTLLVDVGMPWTPPAEEADEGEDAATGLVSTRITEALPGLPDSVPVVT